MGLSTGQTALLSSTSRVWQKRKGHKEPMIKRLRDIRVNSMDGTYLDLDL